MNMTIVLALDDNDMRTQTIRSINGFPSKNPYKYTRIDCNGNILEPNLLHIPGVDRTIEITLMDSTLRFNSKYEIKISGKCLIAISHFNDFHANDANNEYFQSLDYNQTILQNLPLFPADYSVNGWQCIDRVHSISASKIKSTGIENLITDFESGDCQYLMTLYNNFIAEA